MNTILGLTAVFQESDEGGYIGFIEEIPGINTQGETLAETKKNLQEAFELVMDTTRKLADEQLKNTKYIKEPFESV